MQVYRRQGKLLVHRVEVTPHVVLRHFEVRVSAPVRWRDANAFMAQGDFDALGGLPFHRAVTHDRLAEWRRYLEWKEKLIRANHIKVPYAAWRWESETVLAFLIQHDDFPPRRLDGVELGASVLPSVQDVEGTDGETEQPQRQKRSRDPDVTELGEFDGISSLNLREERDRDDWGDVELTPKHRCIRVRVDEDAAEGLRRRGPPAVGQLLSSMAGDLAPLRNQLAGVDRLNNSQGFSPRLADFVFSSRNAGVPPAIAELRHVPGSRELNEGQRDAVARALAAPDLCLVQGPPGTGKTTVIADICLRATAGGQRVLVASQTNLAVDNALARLANAPGVRPLRLGDPGRVDDEFRDFLAENVVDRWFASIIDHCRDRMRNAEHEAADLAAREQAVGEMRQVLAEHASMSEELGRAIEKVPVARAALSESVNQAKAAQDNVSQHSGHIDRLAALERWAHESGPLPSDAVEESWPEAVHLPDRLTLDLPPPVAVDRARERKGPLTPVLQAVESALSGAASNVTAAVELRELRGRKSTLIDSVDDADMQQLRIVNRRIRQLEESGWNQLTGALHRAARQAWPDGVPACIAVVVDALAPTDATSAALEECLSLVRQEVAIAYEAADAAQRSASEWRDRLRLVKARLQAAQNHAAQADRVTVAAQKDIDAAVIAEAHARAAVRDAERRWEEACWRAGDTTAPTRPSQEALDALAAAVRKAVAADGQRLKRASRWRAVQASWIERLGAVSDSDREHLQMLYVRHSNVVGMTCNEAGKRKTWQDPEFKPFDIVIVDEVSKATPPELILPLLLGQKAVLVGDHRQLPPMFRERDASFGEAASEGEVTKEDFERFRRMVTASLFEDLFEQAPDEIKAMLWTQYRMHPHIMDAVNQFYEGRLEPGPDRERLAQARGHYLDVPANGGGRILTPHQHLLWIDSSKASDGRPAWEEQQGSSKVNRLEIDMIAAMLVRIGRALTARGYGQTLKLKVPRSGAEQTWEEFLRQQRPELPAETLVDLFQEGRIRMDGRAQKRSGTALPGALVEVRRQKEIGVITFYGAQLRELRKKIERTRSDHPEAFASVELRTNTVNRFQGMEKPIVLASLVRAKRGKLGEFVREFQRINVGLSRAQQLLVIVGAEDTWKQAQVPLPPLSGGVPVDTSVYLNILDLARQRGGRRLARQVLLP
jgi:hypothetical protein